MDLIREPEVQTLITLIRGGAEVLLLLLRRHLAPDGLPGLVPPAVPSDGEHVASNRKASNSNQHPVAATIQRGIVRAVDIHINDGSGLNKHVVNRRCDGPRTNGAGVAGGKSDLDSVRVRVSDEESHGGILSPAVGSGGENSHGDDKCKTPHLRKYAPNQAHVEFFGKMGENEEHDDEESGRRNREEVRGEDVVVHLAEGEGEVGTHGTGRDGEQNSDEVERPEVVVLESTPQEAEGESFTIVHVALGGVIA